MMKYLVTDKNKKTLVISEETPLKTLGRACLIDGKLAADHAASGFAMNLNCEGDIILNITSTKAIKLSVTVDETTTKNIAVGEGISNIKVATGLSKDIHTLEVVNETGLVVDSKVDVNSVSFNGTVEAAPENKDLYIEFIGDSISAGYGLSVTSGDHHDATLAHPYLATKILDADYTILAKSGMGVAYSENEANIFENVYPYVNTTRSQDKFTPVRTPNLVVINLHTNDDYQWYSVGGNKEGDYYNKATFDAKFGFIIKTVTAQYGKNIPMLFVFGCVAKDNYRLATERSIELLEGKYTDEGYNVAHVMLPTNRSGRHSHPNAEGARLQAEALASFIRDNYSVFN